MSQALVDFGLWIADCGFCLVISAIAPVFIPQSAIRNPHPQMSRRRAGVEVGDAFDQGGAGDLKE
ncbi:MAG: hypothetical protein DMF66_17430, partial [Acidobacteria bacterium]